ncbi:Protein of unknown function (DUF4236) [Cyclonatronum proteinivorum]|uniref:DUF4236 domain-containing protein n=1 Tax=Cyclonatronum proteinivorum TaxID=1457365 RepID=A0A345ULY1_9BACT|nr:DUF4236 domain-containing protein [Cyclonatronum proteinivorum]AXJ01483.1 Protein of unknown function (DUF4236) [Cyclonatronum proteinivorum]
MPFFLRKSISSGPVRINFSKGGIGLSAGVTGARIGFNKNGAYVAGGRHGLYYREKIGKKGRNRSRSSAAGAKPTVEQFVDTGLTYHEHRADTAQLSQQTSSSPKYADPLVRAGFWGGWIIIITGIMIPSLLTAAAGILLLIISSVAKKSRIQQAKRVLKQTEESLEKIGEADKPDKLLEKLAEPAIIEPERSQRNLLLAEAAVTLFMDGTTSFNRFDLESYLRSLALPEQTITDTKLEAINELIADCLSDHMLSTEEEQHIWRIIQDCGVPPQHQQQLKTELNRYAAARALIENLQEISCPVMLTRGERCYFKTEGRLLKRKQLGRHQRDGVIFKQLGYETDMEGSIYVTNKHIHITDGNTRSIRLNHITSITEDLIENVITLSLNNRVNPVYLTAKDTISLSFLINHLLSE